MPCACACASRKQEEAGSQGRARYLPGPCWLTDQAVNVLAVQARVQAQEQVHRGCRSRPCCLRTVDVLVTRRLLLTFAGAGTHSSAIAPRPIPTGDAASAEPTCTVVCHLRLMWSSEDADQPMPLQMQPGPLTASGSPRCAEDPPARQRSPSSVVSDPPEVYTRDCATSIQLLHQHDASCLHRPMRPSIGLQETLQQPLLLLPPPDVVGARCCRLRHGRCMNMPHHLHHLGVGHQPQTCSILLGSLLVDQPD